MDQRSELMQKKNGGENKNFSAQTLEVLRFQKNEVNMKGRCKRDAILQGLPDLKTNKRKMRLKPVQKLTSN